MLYQEYEEYKRKFLESQRNYNAILDEIETLFSRTQPKPVDFEKERVSGTASGNQFDSYVMEKERKRLDERLIEAKSILYNRECLLSIKEKQLRESKNIYDVCYVLRYLDRIRVYKISSKTHYSEAQIYRILHIINDQINDDRK